MVSGILDWQSPVLSPPLSLSTTDLINHVNDDELVKSLEADEGIVTVYSNITSSNTSILTGTVLNATNSSAFHRIHESEQSLSSGETKEDSIGSGFDIHAQLVFYNVTTSSEEGDETEESNALFREYNYGRKVAQNPSQISKKLAGATV
ncbi:unnamed protein product [Gongylonema pulchrum]|uniref:Uncharacterized protein n=1 Tax=Gongylonema pulchrum TaxID=637853 RepID=A0A183CXJ8_9BILA|nr:unnamed protein product [Gongylonema pulchrum]